jgi:hypothetical protein
MGSPIRGRPETCSCVNLIFQSIIIKIFLGGLEEWKIADDSLQGNDADLFQEIRLSAWRDS